jgi:DHA1 family quinolone resistance protein-like MFS transporter
MSTSSGVAAVSPGLHAPERAVPATDGVAASPRSDGILRRDFLILTTAHFSLSLATAAFFLLPRHLKETGISRSEIGMIMAASGLASLVLMPLFGPLFDRYGRRVFLLLGAALMAAACAAFPIAHATGQGYFVLRILQGISFAAWQPAALVLVADLSPKGRLAESLALFGVFGLSAQAIAPGVGEEVVNLGGYTALYLSAGVGALIALGLALVIKVPDHHAADRPPPPSTMGLLRRPELTFTWVAVALMCSGFAAAITFVPAYAGEVKLPRVSPFFISFTLTAIAARVLFGRLTDRLPRIWSIVPPGIISVLSLVVLALAPGTRSLYIAGIGLGIGHVAYPVLNAYVLELAGVNDPKITAFHNVAWTAGTTVAMFSFGRVAQAVGYDRMFLIAASVVCCGLLVFGTLARPPRPAQHTVGL